VIVLPPNASVVGYVPSAGGQPVLAQSNWELVLLGVIPAGAIPPQDGATSPAPWVFQIQATAGGANSSIVDVDSIIVADASEDMLVAEIPGATLPSLGSWVCDLSRFGRQGVTVSPTAGGTATAYASVTGQMAAGQGDTLYTVMAEISDSHGRFITDLSHTAFTIGAVVQPVYEAS